MQWVPVSSSNVARIGYDAQSHVLGIEFTNGRVYQYFDVPEGIYEAFLASGSKGGFLAEQIKGVFRYARA
jgi:hypothetical protein